MFDKFIDEKQDEIISAVSELVKIPSVTTITDNPTTPFGEHCTNALNYILELGNSMGFRTKNIDNYCGYIEFGEGEELVGIIGHLDVVPALETDGWTTPPFSPVIRDGKLFGRGTIDDKGPVVSALYAMKAIKDTCQISKRVRLIIGLNEERGWKCIDYYKEHEEWPSIGFSPDANFPAIFAEKGILSLELKNQFEFKDFEIISISTNNNAINVVPKYAAIQLKQKDNSSIDLDILSNTFVENIKTTILDNNSIQIESFGIASHAARPHLGTNAIKILVEFLLNNFEFNSDYLKQIYDMGLFDIHSPKFLSETTLEDESGILTSNVAVMDYIDNKLVFQINLRVPVTISLDEIQNKYTSISNEIEVTRLSVQEPLYVEKDSFLVTTLLNVFKNKTGLDVKPIAIGGGTYARAFKNFISYGANMPGNPDLCHQVDEYIKLDDLNLATKIYANAIYELSK